MQKVKPELSKLFKKLGSMNTEQLLKVFEKLLTVKEIEGETVNALQRCKILDFIVDSSASSLPYSEVISGYE